MSNPFDKYLSAEQRIHAQLAAWMRLQYPNAFWWHTANEGKKTPFERYLFGKMGCRAGIPDFIIAEPTVSDTGTIFGLAVELKKDGERLYKKDGSPYFPEQHNVLSELRMRGWEAKFAVGFDEAQKIISEYLD